MVKNCKENYWAFYRTLPLIDDIADRLLELKEQQEYFKKAFGKSYYKKDQVLLKQKKKLRNATLQLLLIN